MQFEEEENRKEWDLAAKFAENHVPEIFFKTDETKHFEANLWGGFDLRKYLSKNQEDSGIYGARFEYRGGYETENRLYVFKPKDAGLIGDIQAMVKGIVDRKEKFILEDHFTIFQPRMEPIFNLETTYFSDSDGSMTNPCGFRSYSWVEEMIKKL